MEGTLIFDGRCGFCTRAHNALLRMNRTGNLRTQPMQVPGTAERVGVTPEELGRSVWWLDSSGQVFAAAEAANAAVSAALGTRIPLWLYRLYGVRQIQEWVYRWIADHRYRFPGVTPFCESDPGACRSGHAG